METPTPQQRVLRFEDLNWVATGALPRDREQRHRLHEPDHRVNTIDPMTGRDIWNLGSHPSIVDGRLTIYFESEETRTAFEKMHLNHPLSHWHGETSDEGDRGG